MPQYLKQTNKTQTLEMYFFFNFFLSVNYFLFKTRKTIEYMNKLQGNKLQPNMRK